METIHQILEIIIQAVQFIAILVLLWGGGKAIKDFIMVKRGPHKKHPLLLIKIELGRYILLGLEILIVADIIKSILDPNWEGILMLASIVAIRTLISFFLNHEIQAELCEPEEKLWDEDESA
ncbi:MAG: DUF1622 domain-containing protein [Clostridiales bacterium]|nr:DUF1622 domain-containing protein [Clostridiales bacterium]